MFGWLVCYRSFRARRRDRMWFPWAWEKAAGRRLHHHLREGNQVRIFRSSHTWHRACLSLEGRRGAWFQGCGQWRDLWSVDLWSCLTQWDRISAYLKWSWSLALTLGNQGACAKLTKLSHGLVVAQSGPACQSTLEPASSQSFSS